MKQFCSEHSAKWYGKDIVMKTVIFRYILFLQLFIHAISIETEVKYEITNKEATKSHLAMLEIVKIVTEKSENQTANFTSPNGNTNTTEQNNIKSQACTTPVYKHIVKLEGNNFTLTDSIEQNDLDAVFMERTNLSTEFTETKNLTKLVLEILKYEKRVNESAQTKYNSTHKYFGYKNMTPQQLGLSISHNDFVEINTLNEEIDGSQKKNLTKIKQILQWTSTNSSPFTKIISAGRRAFIDRNCSYTNCVVIKRTDSIVDFQNFDAVVFFAKDLRLIRKNRTADVHKLLEKRLPHQKYVFASLEYYKFQRAIRYNNFFNWTWTFKLDSDLTWSPFVVKDVSGNVVAPKENVTWLKKTEMLPVSNAVMKFLRKKTVALAWIYPCKFVHSKGYCYARKLIRILYLHYGISVDKFSRCWYDNTTKEIRSMFSDVLQKDYYFYLAFEDIEREDYVSDKIFDAVNNFAVPIVFGGANYSRFLPSDSYLDATKHSPHTLAKEIFKLIRDFDLYVEYFKWTNHYTIHRPDESPQTDHICKMCELMNDENKLNETTYYKNFADWWGYEYISKKSLSTESTIKYDNIDAPTEPKIKGRHYMTPKEFIRKIAYAYTTLIDSVLKGVKTTLFSLMG